MDVNRYIEDYLKGHPDCHSYELAREGPAIIDPLLHISLPVLRSIGAPLADILQRTQRIQDQLGIDAATTMAKGQFHEEMEAGVPVDAMFRRTQQLIVDLAFDRGDDVGTQLYRALQSCSDDLYLSLFAAVHAGTKGIPADSITGGLLRTFAKHAHPLLDYAITASMLSYVDVRYNMNAGEDMVKFAYECYYLLPALTDRVKNTYLPKGHRVEQDVLLTKLACYYLILIS